METEDKPLETGGPVVAEATAKNVVDEGDVTLSIGDFLEFTAGPKVGTKGKIYYLSPEVLYLLPEGVSDRLVEINLEEVLGDETTELKLDPRNKEKFLQVVDIKEGNLVQTFTKDGQPAGIFKIESVNQDEDSAVFVPVDADGTVVGNGEKLEFTVGETIGIPTDMEFAVIRAQEMPKLDVEEEKEEEEEEEEEEVNIEDVIEEGLPENDEYIVERKPEEIVYEEHEQKADFVEAEKASLKPSQQTNPRLLLKILRLMENCNQLRKDIVEYLDTGTVVEKPVVYETLAALLERTSFPLAKKVLAVYRTLYLDHSENDIKAMRKRENGEEDYTGMTIDGNLDIQYLQDAVEYGIDYLKRTLEGPETTKVGDQMPRLYRAFEFFYKTYFSVFGKIDSDSKVETIEYDTDFFRMNVLKTGEPALVGLDHVDRKASEMTTVDEIKGLDLSYMRALSSRQGKYGDRKRTTVRKVEAADEVEVLQFVLFPFLFLRDLGAIRSGKLTIDVGNGLTNPKTMKMILEEAKGAKVEPNPNNIFVLDANGATAGRLEVQDWLKGQPLYGNGIGDLLPYLKSFGLFTSEFTPEQQKVLFEKIQIYQANLKKFIFETRKAANEIIQNPDPVVNFSFLTAEDQKTLMSILQSERMLSDKIEEFVYQYPAWKENDIAIFSYLYTTYPDYVLATLSQVPTNVATERLRAVNDLFLRALQDSILYKEKLKQQGDEPIINECDHVANLETIRALDNDDTKIQIMLQKFLPTFAGKTEDHWIFCKVCKGHLLCEHEYLMILEKTNPNQKDIIHKKILLTFSDGVFNGKFICGTCGQPIQEMEFDQSMEFDDEGRPMMGNEPISQEMETTLAKELDKLLDVKQNDLEKPKLKDVANQGERAVLINQISTLLGAYFSADAFERVQRIVERAVSNRSFKDQASYNAAIEEDRKKSQKAKRYDTFEQWSNQNLISNVAAGVLIEIQTAIPDYVIRSVVPGCSEPELMNGFPLDSDENNVVAMKYLSCALANLVKNERPWNETKWIGIDPTKSEGLKNRIESILQTVAQNVKRMAADAEVRILLAKKSEYLIKEKGKEAATGRYVDQIPSDFLPLPIKLTEEQLSNAEAPTIGEAAPPSQKAYAWILEGHKLAKLKGVYEKGNPLSEASCCYSSLEQPMKFWSEQSLPVLGPKQPPKGPRGSLLALVMKVRDPEDLLGQPDANLMYRLFMRVCFPREGIVNPRVGLPHEPGYNNKCPYCQFEFPTDPRMPPPELSYSKNKDVQKAYDEQYKSEVEQLYQADISALQKAGAIQGDGVETKSFEALLKATNSHFLIPNNPVRTVALGEQTLNGLASLDPEPYEGFSASIITLRDALAALPPDAEKSDVSIAYGPISTQREAAKTSLQEYFNSKIPKAERVAVVNQFNRMWNAPPQTLGEILRTFLLIPLQRALKESFRFTTLRPRDAIYKDIGDREIVQLTDYLTVHANQVPKVKTILEASREKAKVEDAIKLLIARLTVVIPTFINVLRTNVVPYGSTGLPYIQGAILTQMLWEFVNLHEDGSKTDTGTILSICLTKAQDRDENTLKTPEEIRKLITSRNESEKMEIINELDKMAPEEKRAELAMKALGLGRWARGASKGIFSYDEEQQAFEAAERERRGIVDFYGLSGQEPRGDGDGYDNYANDGEEG
jgi:hypothetical protein